MDVPMPGDGGDNGTNSYTFNASDFVLPDYGTNLWIAQFGISSGSLVGIVSNSSPDISYEIQSLTDLTQAGAGWNSEGFILGSELTNWTPMSVAQNGRTNLFLRIRSWADDGSGLPIWWQMQYFGTTGVDPFAFDSSGDGFTLWQDFEAGYDPTTFHTPPAPQNLKVQVDNTGLNVSLSWQTGGGNVSQYHVEELLYGYYSIDLGTVPATQTNFSTALDQVYYGTIYEAPAFRITALFTNGYSSASATIDLESSFAFPLQIIRNSQGQFQLIAGNLPADVTLIHLFWSDDPLNPAYYDVPVTNIVNGVYTLPENVMEANATANDTVAEILRASGQFDWEGYVDTEVPNVTVAQWPGWINNSAYFLKDNLHFLLRSATINHSFSYDSSAGWNRSETGPTHEYSGYHYYDSYWDTFDFDATRPMCENYLWRNFAYVTGDLNTGATVHNGGRYIDGPEYEIQSANLPPNAIPSPLLTDSTTSFYFYSLAGYAPYTEIGLGVDVNANVYLPDGVQNLYGLRILAVKGYSGAEVDAGAPATFTLDTLGSPWYVESALPSLTTVNYYFASQTPYIRFDVPMPAAPGNPAFSPTNTSPLLITGVGQPFGVMGWAKQSINGSNDKFAYLEQFFDQAYTKDTNGVATTNKAGFVSAYGNFFPMVPGPAALVTMPDVDTGERGTCTVNCFSEQVDKNNDGNMDLSFNGPDATSLASPMVWWVNNDYDWASQPGYPVFDPGSDTPITTRYSDQFLKDYLSLYPNSIRDLEDWSRLWICGVPALTNGNYQVTLSWANVSGTPAINLIQSCETNGGTLYLTDTNVLSLSGTAWRQISSDYGYKYHVPTTGTLTLPGNWFTNASNKYFLFEGAGIGSGELVMTISQNGNTIAQTGVWLDLHDVKDFYERAVITNNISGSISNWTSGIESVTPATASALGDDTNLIVLVHGFNVGNSDWLIESDTVFKRLYWAGYHGKFMTVKWPDEPVTLWTGITENTSIFNNSEIKSYKAATALKNYLSQLRSRFPNYRLNVLAHSQGNAIMGEAIEQGAPFDTYILTQGAMPASSYDVNALTDSTLLTAEALVHTPEWKPMGYHGVYTNMTGKIVSYYNPQDFVLNIWNADQAAGKPDSYANHVLFPLAPYYSYDGANGWWNGIIYGLFSSYLVTDPQESRAMISRSRTQPVGRQNTGGVINSTIDLNAQFGFSDTTAEHSAEWTRPIQTCLPYYVQILNTIRP